MTEMRTAVDLACKMKALVDEHFPGADVINVVLDNLNIHGGAALYETFPPEEARRIVRKLEFPYTSKHGSWLNIHGGDRTPCSLASVWIGASLHRGPAARSRRVASRA